MEQAKVEEIKKLRDQQIVLLKKGIRIAKYPEPKKTINGNKKSVQDNWYSDALCCNPKSKTNYCSASAI